MISATSLAAAALKLFDHLPDVYLFVKDLNHTFRAVNEAEWRFHGCRSSVEMVGKKDSDFHPPVMAQQYVAEDCRVVESGRPLVDRIWLVAGADGRLRWYSCTKLPVYDAFGTVIGVAGLRRPHDHTGHAPGEYSRLTAAMEHVLTHYGEPVRVPDLARRARMSVSAFQREFRRLFRITPREYLMEVRLHAARRALEQTSQAIGTIAMECGFCDQSYFVKRFKAATGLRPLEYRLWHRRGAEHV